MDRARSWWGWGEATATLDDQELRGLAELLAQRLDTEPRAPAPIRDPSELPPPSRVRIPDRLAPLASFDPIDRVRHAHGAGFRDVVRALHGELGSYPDVVLRPADADDVERMLGWAGDAGVACVPFGGGSSVVGGVTTPVDDRGVAVLDLERITGVPEVEPVSRTAYVRAGTLGPALADALRPHGLTLRFYPQSYEWSTLGGWVATRAGGHFATGPTRIDDLVAAVDAVTPAGRWEGRRLPSSGAGPSPDRLLLGSEGTLGVLTGAWVRVRPRPGFRARTAVTFAGLDAGLSALRALVQSGARPADARLLDADEAAFSGAGDGTRAVLLLGLEGTDHPLDDELARAVELLADHGGRREGAGGTDDGGAAASWRSSFLRAPYLRDGLVRLGMVVETLETAAPWDRVGSLVASVTEALHVVAAEVCGGAQVTVRVTHAYPDGCAPYFTVVAPGRRGAEVTQWDALKSAASDAVLRHGGTITHHHAVGRDHVPWYGRQRPAPFASALAGAKAALDPAGVCNPGVLGL